MNGIGNTPLIKLERLPEPGSAEIWVKYEGANPTGSMKDRMALSMIEGAECRGELNPGGSFSGNAEVFNDRIPNIRCKCLGSTAKSENYRIREKNRHNNL